MKSDAHKQMIKSCFGRRFHDLKYFQVGILSIFLEFIMHFGASSQNSVENHQFDVIIL